ncbi:uncharacterized protein LOC122259917 [Penaeus japonicus]|uniref:uncharacterized protein LOC122259917 n=1 Tax=Penaeus japonicus TaxID=27405 RepID=UPI001C7116DD|nr:uncharacterized protein LOC122259917 [Penaeus japonicus]
MKKCIGIAVVYICLVCGSVDINTSGKWRNISLPKRTPVCLEYRIERNVGISLHLSVESRKDGSPLQLKCSWTAVGRGEWHRVKIKAKVIIVKEDQKIEKCHLKQEINIQQDARHVQVYEAEYLKWRLCTEKFHQKNWEFPVLVGSVLSVAVVAILVVVICYRKRVKRRRRMSSQQPASHPHLPSRPHPPLPLSSCVPTSDPQEHIYEEVPEPFS